MEQQSDSSYQEDILKVKKIWNDIKGVEKYEKKTQNNLKIKKDQESQKKKVIKQREQVNQSNIKKVKSQLTLKPSTKENQNDQIIQFSTVSPRQINFKPIVDPTSNYLEVYNLQRTLQQKDKQLSLLRTTNQQLKDQLHHMKYQLKQKDILISKLQSREHELLGETSKFQKQSLTSLTQSVEYTNQKNDSIRLLKMLQSTKEYQQFAQLALQDNGVRCLHMVNQQSKKSKIDAIERTSKGKTNLHFCSCNTEFLPQSNLWVPEDAYNFAKQFVTQNRNQKIGQAQVQLLLYELNKIWRQRQKKLNNRLSSSKALEIGKYKRRILDIQKIFGKSIQIAQ